MTPAEQQVRALQVGAQQAATDIGALAVIAGITDRVDLISGLREFFRRLADPEALLFFGAGDAATIAAVVGGYCGEYIEEAIRNGRAQ